MGGFGAVLYVCQYDTDPRTQDDNIFFFFPSLTFIFDRMIGIVFFFFFGKSMIGMSRIVFGSLGLIFSFPCRLLLGRGSWCNSGRPMLCFRPFSCD